MTGCLVAAALACLYTQLVFKTTKPWFLPDFLGCVRSSKCGRARRRLTIGSGVCLSYIQDPNRHFSAHFSCDAAQNTSATATLCSVCRREAWDSRHEARRQKTKPSSTAGMDSSFASSVGEVMVASIGEMTQSTSTKVRDLSRKVTLARLLDDTTSNTDDTTIDGKENGSHTTIVATKKEVFSERSGNNNSSSGSNAGGTVLRTNHAAVEALRNLRDLNNIVSEIERRSAALRDAIDTHRRENSARREKAKTARQQTAQLAATLSALPAHLPHAAPAPEAPAPAAAAAAATATAAAAAAAAAGAGATPAAADSGPAARSRGNPAAAAAATAGRVATSDVPEVPVMDLVTVGELQGVPRSTRARLTIDQVNGAVAEIQKAVERRCA